MIIVRAERGRSAVGARIWDAEGLPLIYRKRIDQ